MKSTSKYDRLIHLEKIFNDIGFYTDMDVADMSLKILYRIPKGLFSSSSEYYKNRVYLYWDSDSNPLESDIEDLCCIIREVSAVENILDNKRKSNHEGGK